MSILEWLDIQLTDSPDKQITTPASSDWLVKVLKPLKWWNSCDATGIADYIISKSKP